MKRCTPSYKGLKPASEASSKAKRANRSTRTKHELLLMKELRSAGIKFKNHDSTLPGKPDVVIEDCRTAIFCDGDFWHGRRWQVAKSKLASGSNSKYWIAKIESNIRRDKRNTRKLRNQGWKVVRIWESSIHANSKAVVQKIKQIIAEVYNGN